ncbi:hypothetical protein [Dongia sp.]|uniref:anti-sigma factor family protein n=1 Tax=Dongia sp. TaxID=1977262 RepID=UPI0035B1DB49
MTVNSEQIGDDMIERVMQYCDGKLKPAEMAQVAAEIAANPDLQKLAADLTRGASLAREAFSGIINDPVPLHLARAITQAPEPAQERPNRKPGVISSMPRQVAAALIGLLIGGAVIGLWSSRQDSNDGLRLAGLPEAGSYSPEFKAALADLLTTPGSARTQKYVVDPASGNEAEISVVTWFKLSDGSTCAEFRQDAPTASPAHGLACQRDTGAWDIMMRSPAE